MVFDQPHGSAAQTIISRHPKDSYKYYTFIDLKVHSHTEESESIIRLLDRLLIGSIIETVLLFRFPFLSMVQFYFVFNSSVNFKPIVFFSADLYFAAHVDRFL